MRSPIIALSYLALTSATSILSAQPQYVFSNPPIEATGYRIPTIHESAIMARRILHLTTIGNLVTTFPEQTSSEEADTMENRPAGMAGNPIGLLEYYADCEHTGNPTLLAIDIATPYKNYIAGSNISLSVRWWPKTVNHYSTTDDDDEDIPTPHSPAALPRFSLHGHLEKISKTDLLAHLTPACFARTHPDSLLWQPGNDISHESSYVRLVVEHVYWFGGFGDRARIGWLPLDEWKSVTVDEIMECRLPGEGKKKEKSGSWSWRDWL